MFLDLVFLLLWGVVLGVGASHAHTSATACEVDEVVQLEADASLNLMQTQLDLSSTVQLEQHEKHTKYGRNGIRPETIETLYRETCEQDPHSSGCMDYLISIIGYNAECALSCPPQVVKPRTIDELSKWLSSHREPFVVKGGGHSYTCQSTARGGAVLVDLALMKNVSIRQVGNHTEVHVAGSATLVDALPTLISQNVRVPHAECANVGLIGFMLNGGQHPNAVRREGQYVKELRGVTSSGMIIKINTTGGFPLTGTAGDMQQVVRLMHEIEEAYWTSIGLPTESPLLDAFTMFGLGPNFLVVTDLLLVARSGLDPTTREYRFTVDCSDQSFRESCEAFLLHDKFLQHVLDRVGHFGGLGLTAMFHKALNGLATTISIRCTEWTDVPNTSTCDKHMEAVVSLAKQLGPAVQYNVDQDEYSKVVAWERQGFGWEAGFMISLTNGPMSTGDFLKQLIRGIIETDCDFAFEIGRLDSKGALHRRSSYVDDFGTYIDIIAMTYKDSTSYEKCKREGRRLRGEVIKMIGVHRVFGDPHLPFCTDDPELGANLNPLYGGRGDAYGLFSEIRREWDNTSSLAFPLGLRNEDDQPLSCDYIYRDRIGGECIALSDQISQDRLAQARQEHETCVLPWPFQDGRWPYSSVESQREHIWRGAIDYVPGLRHIPTISHRFLASLAPNSLSDSLVRCTWLSALKWCSTSQAVKRVSIEMYDPFHMCFGDWFR